jgi:hypothetical protein
MEQHQGGEREGSPEVVQRAEDPARRSCHSDIDESDI